MTKPQVAASLDIFQNFFCEFSYFIYDVKLNQIEIKINAIQIGLCIQLMNS